MQEIWVQCCGTMRITINKEWVTGSFTRVSVSYHSSGRVMVGCVCVQLLLPCTGTLLSIQDAFPEIESTLKSVFIALNIKASIINNAGLLGS